ncbi:V-type ATP synthase subunit E [Candidatus Nanohalococcus occultus]|uniref:A-type ATP synthase subunit E n=1 Tax=Candidatus Nanohalococcus occultus TaxID=2978047 RepID=A0ABY8CER2_9ARCH|nr:Archaeal/vacuolar-type H -ATPase subunit E [Candidatus Nanohaloarchaeota archaeon SVXNc]
MGLKEVKDDILQEAQQQADSITSDAQSKADEIIEEAENEADRILQEAEEEIEEEKESLEKQQLSNARMEAKKKKLDAKQNALEQVFDRFRDELEELSGEERQKFVANCLERAEFEVGTVKASEEFKDVVESEGFEPEDFHKTGLVVVSEDGNRKQEYSLDRIVQSLKDEHRKEVSEVLF